MLAEVSYFVASSIIASAIQQREVLQQQSMHIYTIKYI